MSAAYVVRPKADQDLDHEAYYLALRSSAEVGHRFLLAAHETFSLLATQPRMGWRCRLRVRGAASVRVFRVTGFENMRVFYRPQGEGVDMLRVVHGS